MARNARKSLNKRRGTSKKGGQAPRVKRPAAKQAKQPRRKKARSRRIGAEERLERFVEQYQNKGMSWAEARLSARAKMREKAV
jgi:hypothetical protein